MTDPHTGPPAGSGPGEQPGAMPSSAGTGTGGTTAPGSMAAPGSTEAGNTGAGATSGVATARRTSATQTGVPQQLGHQQERIAGETDTGQMEMGAPGMSPIAQQFSAAANKAWWAVLLGALGMVALGIALLVWPHASLTVVAILIGAAVLVSGLVRLYEGFTARAESGGMRAGYVVIGLLAVLAGIYLLRHHALSLFLVAFVTGVYFIAHGISDLGVAISGATPNRGLRGVLGVFSLAAGIIMVIWPGITLVLLFTLVAAWLLFYGLMLAVLAFSLRRTVKSAENAIMPSQRLAASTR
jgi:uncharacterized membrane protein HdeD (DUF308 family)